MISATLLAFLAAAAPAKPSPAGAILKAPAATAPSCQTTRVDDKLVRATLFAPESAECPVAKVAGDTIVLRELAEVLESDHLTMRRRAASPGGRPQMDFSPALDRLISMRLLVLEGREMRLDDTPEFRVDVQKFQESRERALLQQEIVKGLKPDAGEVERLYRQAVKEWKIKSVLLEKEDAAKAFEAALKAGQGFDAVAKQFVAEKKAKGGGAAEFVPPKRMLNEVRAAVAKAKPGVPTGLVKVSAGWIVLRVDGMRYPPNDKAARAAARAAALERAEHVAVRKFYSSLVKKYATVDEPLLKSIDFEAGGEKGFEALAKDERPLVKIQGEKPIMVADLTREVSMKFFHGIASPIRDHHVNPQKDETFEKVLGTRVFAKEIANRKLGARPEIRREIADYERALVFNAVLDKVIRPDVKVSESDAMSYYEAHKAEYSSPQMYKLEGIAFPTAREAQAALDKLNAGTDFAWLRTSAPGQLPPEARSLQFEGATLSANMLPPELTKALTGASAGAYRLYSHKDGEVYVIRVAEQISPAAQPYPEAREAIAKKLFNERLTQGIRDYADKLRKAQKVDVLITRVSM
jgi:parvulin-like peptidyl-prolyl isomerase